jgi:hypothetical protein
MIKPTDSFKSWFHFQIHLLEVGEVFQALFATRTPFLHRLFRYFSTNQKKTGDQRWQRTIPQFVEDVPATYAANDTSIWRRFPATTPTGPTGPTGPVASLQHRTGTFGIEVLGRGGEKNAPFDGDMMDVHLEDDFWMQQKIWDF